MILELPDQGIVKWSVFTPFNIVTGTQRSQTWIKPSGAQMLFILAVGGGGGGGGGTASAVSRTGGGGGGSAGIGRWIGPASLLPEVLYVYAGAGGGGGASGAAGANGNFSVVGYSPDMNATGAYQIMAMNGATGGSAAGAAGNAGGSNPTTGQFFGIYNGTSGQAGGAQTTTGSTPADMTPSTSLILSGGTAGGGAAAGVNARGGRLTAQTSTTGIVLRPELWADTAAGSPGISGYNRGVPLQALLGRNQPLIFTGGSGGTGSDTGTGGRGGDGAWGCGGGGGGAGTTGQGGVGGRGGDGFVIIGAW